MSKIARVVYMEGQEPWQHAIVTRYMPKTRRGPIARAPCDEEPIPYGVSVLVADVVPYGGSVVHKSYRGTHGHINLGKALDRVCSPCGYNGNGRCCITDGVDAAAFAGITMM